MRGFPKPSPWLLQEQSVYGRNNGRKKGNLNKIHVSKKKVSSFHNSHILTLLLLIMLRRCSIMGPSIQLWSALGGVRAATCPRHCTRVALVHEHSSARVSCCCGPHQYKSIQYNHYNDLHHLKAFHLFCQYSHSFTYTVFTSKDFYTVLHPKICKLKTYIY